MHIIVSANFISIFVDIIAVCFAFVELAGTVRCISARNVTQFVVVVTSLCSISKAVVLGNDA